ncbi:uncharacterized protein LOC141853832 [Brevipalpus obovatus]|uniref:uncharacterized protein LOC141853832 n=1 Tax=Brevipalpus obovatus TaxID=246614 RepID=UPI003D9DD69C
MEIVLSESSVVLVMKRHRRYDPEERFRYLRELIDEFNKLEDSESFAKEQVLANLSNFCYDPSNHDNLHKLDLIPLLLHQVQNGSEKLAEFAAKGLCNLAANPKSIEIIKKAGGKDIVEVCLYRESEPLVISILYILLMLKVSTDELNQKIEQRLQTLSQSSSKRISNLAEILLENLRR